MPDKKDIETSIHVLSGLLGYSERMGSVVNSNHQVYCDEHKKCPAKHFRVLYETALKTALEVLITHLDES